MLAVELALGVPVEDAVCVADAEFDGEPVDEADGDSERVCVNEADADWEGVAVDDCVGKTMGLIGGSPLVPDALGTAGLGGPTMSRFRTGMSPI